MVIDSEIKSRIKRALADNITTRYKDESMKKVHMIIITTIDHIPTDIVNEPNNTNNEMYEANVAETTLKLVYDSQMERVPCQEIVITFFMEWIQSTHFMIIFYMRLFQKNCFMHYLHKLQ